MERIRNDEVSWSLDAFKDDLGRKFGPICSDAKSYGEALLLCSARFNRHSSTTTEL